MSEQKAPSKIHYKSDLEQYFKGFKAERQRINLYNKSVAIPLTARNISNTATESLLCHLMIDGIVKLKGIPTEGLIIERRGNDADEDLKSDLLIYTPVFPHPIKVESKATASKDGFTNNSIGNLKNYALIHMDFYRYVVNERHPFIYIKAYYDLEETIKPELMEGNGQEKNKMSNLVGGEDLYPDGFNLFEYLGKNDNPFFE